MIRTSSLHIPARLGALLLAAAASSGVAGPAAADNLAPADAAALQNFKLTEGFLQKWQAYEKEAAAKPCELSPLLAMQGDTDKTGSMDTVIKRFDGQPGVHDALARNGLTAREAILGLGTLMGAAIQDMAKAHPDMVKNGNITMHSKLNISPANMEFYHQHKAEIHAYQAKLGQEMLKRNGGHLPACLGPKRPSR